jgi:lysine 6-dehydrogenase
MKVIVLGAGMMGKGVALDMARQPDMREVILADRELARAQEVASQVGGGKISPVAFNASDVRRLGELISGCVVAVGATSYDHNILYSRAAIDNRCSFIDLGGNHDVVEEQFALDSAAKDAGVALIPDCGLAPGLVNILSAHAVSRIDQVSTIKIRVGGIPVHPRPPLNYSLVFSARGLINEYIERCRVIKDGRIEEVDSLEGLETLHFQDPFGEMEAFYTSGGISTLTGTMLGRVKSLDYKTIRYPGHQHYIKFLMDLGLTGSEPVDAGGQKVAPRLVLEKLLEIRLKRDDQDATLLRVTSEGRHKGMDIIDTQEIIDFFDKENNLTSMMRMTAFPAAIIALMIARGDIRDRGVLYQEKSIPFSTFFAELEKREITVSTRRQQL